MTQSILNEKTKQRIIDLGGNPSINLYQTLSCHPKLWATWVEFAYSLRKDCQTPRDLRELMILRSAQISESDYEWKHHLLMAKAAGVSEEKINELHSWRQSKHFTDPEQVCLELTEAVLLNNKISEELKSKIAKYFSPSENVELVLSASFYAMVPRVLNSLQVQLE